MAGGIAVYEPEVGKHAFAVAVLFEVDRYTAIWGLGWCWY